MFQRRGEMDIVQGILNEQSGIRGAPQALNSRALYYLSRCVLTKLSRRSKSDGSAGRLRHKEFSVTDLANPFKISKLYWYLAQS
jgi:hypothetical protein